MTRSLSLSLSSKLTSNQILDSLAQRNLKQRLLQLLCNKRSDDINSRDRSIGNLSSRARAGWWRSCRRSGRCLCCSTSGCVRTGCGCSGLWLVLNWVFVVVDFLCVFVVAENLPLDRLGGVVCFVFGGKRSLRHDAQRVGRANLDNSFCGLLREEDILGFDPSHRGGKLVSKKLDKERMCELLLNFGAHDGDVMVAHCKREVM